jgi:NADH dehydrogenase FAD-containing subunit
VVDQNSGLGDARGWISADPHHLTTAYPEVFAMGDAADIRLANGKSLIKCGAIGTFQSYVVSQNVLASLKGKKPRQSYGGWTIYVPEVGEGRAATAIGKLYSDGPPRLWITPISRVWRWNKRLVEYVWKNRARLPI